MKTIVIDAGHGGSDPGGASLGVKEKDLVLPYALLLGQALALRGHRVIHTRVLDDFPSLGSRSKLANEAKADLFVSVHANAGANPSTRGPWTLHFALSTAGADLARRIQKALVPVFGGNTGAVYPDGSGWTGGRTLHVLRATAMPAVLIELGFMTNSLDLNAMTDPEKRFAAVQGVASAIVEWFNSRDQRATALPGAGAF